MNSLARHLPTGVVAILILVLGFLCVDAFTALKEGQSKAEDNLVVVHKRINDNCSRLDKLEATAPYTLKAIERNTAALERMDDNVNEIKILLYRTISEKLSKHEKETYGIDK